MNGDREQIEALYREYWRCMIQKDAEGLRDMMTSDYTLLHMTGLQQSAGGFLRGLRSGTFNYYAADHDSIEVSIHGDEASLVGKSRVLAAVYGGGRHLWRLQGDFLLRKEQGVWKLQSFRASTY